jgi:hypothetical protein
MTRSLVSAALFFAKTALAATLMLLLAPLAAPRGALLAITTAHAQRINTGGETGSYHRDFCPALARELTTAGLPHTCAPSSGTRENMERVRTNPRELGYGQLDVFTLESGQMSTGRALEILRQDDARECVFAVTKNRDVTSFGELAAYASTLRFVLPPKESGSAGTFQFLRGIDRNGLGRAGAVTNAASADEAIRQALSRDDSVALFVQFPDPDNERFRLVRELGGHFVPVVDRSILSQQMGGVSVYSAQETRIQNSRSISGEARVTTACTPIVLFSGAADRVRDAGERRQHVEMTNAVRVMAVDVLLPRQSLIRTIGQRTRDLSAEGRDRILSYSHVARDRALPFIERMIERAAPR